MSIVQRRTIKDLKLGEHLCWLYETEEEHCKILTPFLRQGLEQNEKIIYIMGAHDEDAILQYLRENDIQAETFLRRNQLKLLPAPESYLRGGAFDPDRMIEFLRALTQQALDEGFSGLRLTAEMSWASDGARGSERLPEYESKLNLLFRRSPCLGLYQFDRRRFDPTFLLSILAIHPLTLIGTTLHDNLYYLPPACLLKNDSPSAALDCWIEYLESRKQMVEAEREHRALAEALRDTAAVLNSTLNSDEVLERILENVGRVVPHDCANIMLLDCTTNIVQVAKSRGHFAPSLEDWLSRLRFGVLEFSNIRHMFETGQAFLIPDTRSYPGWVELPKSQWIRSNIGAPIQAKGKVMGFLVLDSETPNFFTPAHTARLQAFADQAAIAIENARLFEAERSAHIQAEALREVASTLSESLDSETLLNLILDQLAPVVNYDSTSIMILKGESLKIVAQRGLDDGIDYHSRLRLNELKHLQDVIQFRQTQIIPDTDSDAHWMRIEGNAQHRCWMGVPLMAKGRVIGLLNLDKKQPHFYTENDARLAQAFANQAAVAMENARLFQETQQELAERRRVEEALRESEERYRTLAESAEDEIFIIDRQDRIAYVNSFAAARLGGTRKDVVGKPTSAMFSHETADKQLQNLQQVFRSGRALSSEARMPSPQGEVWLHTRLTPIRDHNGEVASVLGISRDITARKQTEEQLQKLVHAVEQSPSSIVITDVQGNIEYVNPKFTEITGYSLEEAIGKNPRILKSEETPPERYKQLWDTISSGREWRGEFHNKRKNGELFWEYALISPIKNEQEKITHYVAIKEDISSRKSLEEQLRQAQKMEAVGRLAGGVAHDFNNLLTAINGYSELVLNRLGHNDPIRKDIEEIKKAGERAATLTCQLLAFGRKQVLQPRVLDLNAVVIDMEKMLLRLISEDIELKAQLEPELGHVKADPGQLEQIIVNLVVNARDAMPRGGTLALTTKNVTVDKSFAARHVGMSPGRYVRLSVCDTGYGMDAETKSHLFEPFFTTKTKGKGTGLGLSTVYGIVKQSNGYIHVTSEIGIGTTFDVYLPSVEWREAKKESEGGLKEQPDGLETILLVEDEEMIRTLGIEILQMKGYTVLAAFDGAEALAISERYEGPIHLLLTDVVMPQMGGRELAERLTKMRPETKVIYMSGYTDDAIVHYGVRETGIAFLQKPFKPDALTQKVREVLDH